MFGFDSKQKSVLHLTWVAFFLTFAAWFNMAPFNTTIMRTVGLSAGEINILMIMNVALTIPARIVIGTLVDRFGPRRVFSALLFYSAGVCFYFAWAQTFSDFLLARLLMGIVGGGFVVGIKMIAEWFPPGKMGTAQGIYAGWGNFGAAFAAFALPPVAALFPEALGWRVAAGLSGALCLIWAAVYLYFSREAEGVQRNFRLSLLEAIEVTSWKDLVFMSLLWLPVYGAVCAVLWRLAASPAPPFGTGIAWTLTVGLAVLYAAGVLRSLRANRPRLAAPIPPEKRYEFSQVVILCLVYALTFGSELAVVSMFPGFLETTFDLSVTVAGVLGSCFALMNLVTRPGGGWLADVFGPRRTLAVAVAGSAFGYGAMSAITGDWHPGGAVAVALLCSMSLQAGNGACFAVVPLIRRDLTGRLAGLTGAYGNIGAVFFLTALSLVDALAFFRLLGGYALLVLVSLVFLKSFHTRRLSYT